MRFALRTSVLVALLAILIVGVAQAEDPGCYFNDGRINAASHRDCAAPVTIYLTDNEILVLAYDPSIANKPEQFIIRHPRNGTIPGSNSVLAQANNPVSGRPVILSRLATGEYQLNTFFETGAPYIVVWYAGNDLYHLDPVTGQPLDGATTISVPGGATNVAVSSPPPVPVTDGAATVPAADGAPAAAVDPGGPGLNNCRVTITRIVRLRTEPNTTSEIITRLPYRTSWQATQHTGGWFQIVYQDRQGWVSDAYANTSGDCLP
jgi:hypothetical protein